MSMLMGKMVALSQVSVGKVVMLNSQHLGRWAQEWDGLMLVKQ
jgi:hypothetical protein